MGDPPDGAATTLRSYVSRLRAVIGDAASIERRAAGYVLDIPTTWVDVARFEAWVREGHDLLERGRHRRAAEVLRRALDLWRGRPFTGLNEDGTIGAEAVRLEELRLLALESRLEADLELGRGSELVDELEALVASHPFRERLWRHLMLALYRAGRQGDALGAYHRARAALDEQLGIEPGEELRQLEGAILRQDVQQAGGGRPLLAGLPVPLTSFVGRSRELDEVRSLLRRARLVTLVGVGGVGKTRLAIEVAGRAIEDLVDTVAFVDLAAISDPLLLPVQVASSLGVSEAPGRDLAAGLAERVAGTDLLLVLDNCEHLRAAAATLAHSMLSSASSLRILATSREALDVAGEAPYPVAPLALPAVGVDLGAVRDSEAVRLLLERATLTRHDLRVDDDAYATAARICQELDGLPLAIELAAARTKALSLDEIAERLRDRFQFLVSWRRLTAARHRTLREAMDWSYELLGPEEQLLLGRLSVFPAGANLGSIAAVCLPGDEGSAEPLIERLVDASLVVAVESALGTRYRLLETVRQYAAERVPPSDLPALQRRHAERTLAITESLNLGLESESHASRFDLARAELPSIRAAIQWSTIADPSLGIDIAAALERFWAITQARESIPMFTALIAGDVPDTHRARALRCRGGCRYSSGDFAGGVEDYEQALAIHRRLGQRAHQAHLLMRLAMEAHRVGDAARARRMVEEAEMVGGDARFAPDRYVGLGLESDLAFHDGRVDEGFEILERARTRAAEAGDTMWHMDALLRMSERAFENGRLDQAGSAAREALALARDIDDRQSVIWTLGILARLAATIGSHHRAARLWGALESEMERGGPVGQWEFEADVYRRAVEDRTGPGFRPGVAEGRALTLHQAIEEALGRP